jgi:hypothetical protein
MSEQGTARPFGKRAHPFRVLPLRVLFLPALLLLGACSADSIWPTLSGDTAVSTSPGGRINTSDRTYYYGVAAGQQAVATSAITPAGAAAAAGIGGLPAFAPTGTVVGQKVAQLRADLDRAEASLGEQAARAAQFRAATEQASAAYHVTVAAISARLQVGTTPGNPVLVSQAGQAQGALDRIGAALDGLKQIKASLRSTMDGAGRVADEAGAALNQSGAIDEDYKRLRQIQDQVARDRISVDRLIGDIDRDVARQAANLAYERGNLSGLQGSIARGELARSGVAANGGAGAMLEPAPVGKRKPLVVIRFDQPDVSYQGQLSGAVSKALQRRPEAKFDVVSVAAGGEEAANARASADGVVRTINGAGVDAARVSLSETTSDETFVNEVRVYVR